MPDALKRETSRRGIERLADDPYAAALVAQHRLHVYSRYAGHPEWQAFFADVTTARREPARRRRRFGRGSPARLSVCAAGRPGVARVLQQLAA